MRPFVVKPSPGLKGRIFLPGDKSIAHRALIISAISPHITKIKNFPSNQDCLSTVKAFKKLGINIIKKPKDTLVVFGGGLRGLKNPYNSIFIGDSGTTFRLLLGVLAAQGFKVRLTAGKSLSRRPMLRVTKPLRLMGAAIESNMKYEKSKFEEYAPIVIKGGDLRAITYRLPVASAQVKSAILLAGLYAKGETKIIEPLKTRDHTERMLKLFKANVKTIKNTIFIKGEKELVSPKSIYIPGDISSASFFMVAAAIIPNSRVVLKNVGLNSSRLGVVTVLRRMKVNMNITYQKSNVKYSEPIGDVFIESSNLKGATVKNDEIPTLIDELPILMVAASCAKGRTVFEGVGELRVKETDRIKSMTENLRQMGVDVTITKIRGLESIVIKGVKHLRGARVRSFNDHRTAMSLIVAGLSALGNTQIDDISCIGKSFPDFLKKLKLLNK
jgi:3-phosphoshikimate 1-carboxyvinyltransferase